MSDPTLTLLTRNDLDFTVDKTTGRIAWVVKASDGTHATVERGYTGIRDITSLLTGVTAGTVTVARDGSIVTYIFDSVKVSAASQVLFSPAPTNMPMFMPPNGTISTPLAQANTLSARVALTNTGTLKLYNTSTTDGHSGVLTFPTTQAWATTLPGVAVGTGVVYV